ncbi:hypothetical protein ACFSTC_41435 [Nonomuraea ferruginea]
MRRLVADLKPVMGGTQVVDLTVYPTYAIAGAPVKGRKTVYDRYTYRDGVATKDGPGSTVSKPIVDLRKYNWDALPALIRRANRELGVKKPTTRYIIVDAAFHETGAIRVYVSDEYHASGYLAADPTGKVIAKYPLPRMKRLVPGEHGHLIGHGGARVRGDRQRGGRAASTGRRARRCWTPCRVTWWCATSSGRATSSARWRSIPAGSRWCWAATGPCTPSWRRC